MTKKPCKTIVKKVCRKGDIGSSECSRLIKEVCGSSKTKRALAPSEIKPISPIKPLESISIKKTLKEALRGA